jgi:hypothetical protein
MLCSKIEGKLKMLVLKLNLLQKHVGHRKALVASLNMAIGDLYYCQDVIHYKNE